MSLRLQHVGQETAPRAVRFHRKAPPEPYSETANAALRGCAEEGITFKGFGTFIARGNVLDLAVAVIVGSAFTAVVNALVKDILTPLVAAIIGQPDFSRLGFTLGRTHFPVGDFVNALITFLLDALVIYYAVVVPLRTISARFRPAEEPVLALKTCPECLSEIAQDARRCKYCTAVLVRGLGAPA